VESAAVQRKRPDPGYGRRFWLPFDCKSTLVT
jgi:hypothetical protein